MKSILNSLRQAVRSLLSWFADLWSLFNTFRAFARSGFYQTKIAKVDKPYINLVVNGPSVSRILPLFETEDTFLNRPSMVVNFFANTPEYVILKPEYYTLADPMFFQDTPGKSVEKIKDFYHNLNVKTTWPIRIFIPHQFGTRKFYEYSGIDNSMISIIEINGIGYEGFESLRNKCYDRGYCSPCAYTVAIMALYACLKMGYRQIDMYGLDNNYYSSLSLNEQGEVCDVIQHNGEADEYRKILDGCGNPVSLHDYLLGLTYHLKNHELVEKYAEYKGAKILNHSPITMVDAYPRKLD